MKSALCNLCRSEACFPEVVQSTHPRTPVTHPLTPVINEAESWLHSRPYYYSICRDRWLACNLSGAWNPSHLLLLLIRGWQIATVTKFPCVPRLLPSPAPPPTKISYFVVFSWQSPEHTALPLQTMTQIEITSSSPFTSNAALTCLLHSG